MKKTVEIIKANPERARKQKRDGRETLRVAPYCRVSTDDTDQLNSFKSQVTYYTSMVTSKPEWELVDIYADEAISGTLTKKRVDFQRLISDCMSGKVDMVLTKSISRFARNTLDTLKYVRKLKDKGIAVMFEEEHINTLTMDGELLLVILSSVVQQEVENISAHTKRGLQMKMQRGEIVSFSSCLGYDYDVDEDIKINLLNTNQVKYNGGAIISNSFAFGGHNVSLVFKGIN
jgi:DNA invertase Pin-like site-specific DNA recombinase